jgi:inositol-1,3,4-trisphosphate 5/6-kinase/inositol-tetrakisphosphate 1-kinase
MKDFVNQIKEREDIITFGIKIDVPYSFKYELPSLTNNENIEGNIIKIKNSLLSEIYNSDNKMNFPLIIKPNPCTEHNMFLILNEQGIDYFINKENYHKIIKYHTYIVQKYITHDGLMLKNYYINNNTFTITRPSLPNLEGQNLEIKHFENGCFKFHNEFLYKKEDQTFWDGVKISSSVDEFNKNRDALNLISKLFVELKEISLFGLDYLFDKSTGTYYLLEVNYFPSYRELKDNLISEFREHIISYYNSKIKNI